jgi:hypothetical protein
MERWDVGMRGGIIGLHQAEYPGLQLACYLSEHLPHEHIILEVEAGCPVDSVGSVRDVLFFEIRDWYLGYPSLIVLREIGEWEWLLPRNVLPRQLCPPLKASCLLLQGGKDWLSPTLL